MMTAETLMREADSLPLMEQYRLGLRLLERAQMLFAEPFATNQPATPEEARRAALRRVRGMFAGSTGAEQFREEKRRELEAEETMLASRHPQAMEQG